MGYVPGPYSPITDLYDVQANDAHAWVQVWFPGYGWQNFDPTADVPLANPSPGSVLVHSAAATLAKVPWTPIAVAVALVGMAAGIRRRRRRRPATWALQIAADLERGGMRLGVRRRLDETLSAYGQRLAANGAPRDDQLIAVTVLVERYSYAGVEPSADQISQALGFTRWFRSVRRRGGSTVVQHHPRASASASSNEAPAASSGR